METVRLAYRYRSFTYVGKDRQQLDKITFTVAGVGTFSAVVGGKPIELGSPTKGVKGNVVKVLTIELSGKPVSFSTTSS
jgi:hypothetical protein